MQPRKFSHNCSRNRVRAQSVAEVFKTLRKPGEELLPDPEGSLSEHLGSEAIREANITRR